jgi:hypothetical protein
MPGVTFVVRDYRPEDLGQVLQLWQQTGGFDAEGLTVDQSVELLSAADVFAVVAEADSQLVGAVLAAASARPTKRKLPPAAIPARQPAANCVAEGAGSHMSALSSESRVTTSGPSPITLRFSRIGCPRAQAQAGSRLRSFA